MRRSFRRIKGAGFFLWQAKHELFHVLLGLMWAWVLREVWNEFNVKWILTAAFGSLLPDAEHFVYFLTYGKKDPYTQAVVTFLKNKEWRVLVKFVSKGHKYQTSLAFHNYYVIVAFLSVSALSYIYDWRFGVVLFGAMAIHYLYDLVDDVFLLGYINPNWKRFGRTKSRATSNRSTEDVL